MYDLEKMGVSAVEMAARIAKAIKPAPGVVLIYAPNTESAEDSKARWKAENPGESMEGKRVVILRYAVLEQ